ncbi:MAG: class I SAM-dependent methyltransferase [Candidatus Omnitrophica bacterium]|nr:class I SAM-dependent methyltransferase [Candidatus Omnitrophota bacterium]
MLKKLLKSIIPSQLFWIPRYYLFHQRLSLRNHGIILDAGCGEGIVTEDLLKRKLKVVGVDISLAQLRVAESRCHRDIFVQADVGHLPFKDGIFDIVFSLDVLGNVKSIRDVFLEFHRVLKPEGILFISVRREYHSSCKLFVLQRAIRKITPRFLYTRDLPNGMAWLDSTSEEEKERLGNIYSLAELEEKSRGLFRIIQQEYFMKMFTALARDVVYGVKGFYYIRCILFFMVIRIERYFFKRMPGYCIFLELMKI